MKKSLLLLLMAAMVMTSMVGCKKSDTGVKENTDKVVVGDANSNAQDWDQEVNILVIGAGGAGLAAAVEAADNGAEDILIIEKMPVIGGTTFISQGLIAGYETEVAKRLGVHHTEEELYELLMGNASYKLDSELARITVARSGESIDWLMNTVKVPFVEEVKVGYGPLQMMHTIDGGGMGLKEPFMNALEERDIELLLETAGKELIADANGEIVGVLATKDGKDYRIKAKAIVIATGGYAYNTELAETLNPMYKGIYAIGHPATTGDGIIMASNKGAAISNSNHLMAVLKDYEILENHNGNTITASVSRLVSGPNMLFVDKNGKRFMDEKSGGYMSQELNIPIFDQMHKDGTDFVWMVFDQNNIDKTESKRGNDMEFIKADTVEELAALIDMDANNLKETLVKWNEAAANGEDLEFGRSTEMNALDMGPYYAVAVVPAEIITYGGILRNTEAEVLRIDKTPIAGLFTAGETSSNSAYMGFTLSNCITWGRVAGKSAAEHSQNK